MKHKFRSMGRVAIALVLALSLSLVMAVPVSAAEPAVSLDEPWYGIAANNIVEVTVTDATQDVPESAMDELAEPLPIGETVFTVDHDIIVGTAVVMDQAGDELVLHETEPHPSATEVKLAEAPDAETKYIDGADIGLAQYYDDLTIGAQPYQPLQYDDLAGEWLSVSLALTPDAGQTVLVTVGLINAAGGGYIFDHLFVSGAADSVDVPASVKSISYVRATPSAIQGGQTLTLSSTNAIWVSYEYEVTNTVEVTATSTSGGPLTLELTEDAVDSGVFDGSFTLVAETSNGDELVAAHGDTITVTYGTDEATAEVDAEAPTIASLTPAQDKFVITATPTISAVLADPDSGLDEASIVLTVAGLTIDAEAYDFVSETGLLSYTPTEDLAEGSIAVTVDVDDIVGNSATQASWTFTVDTVLPTAPTALTAETMPKRIDLEWTAATDETSGIDYYNIYRGSEGVEALPDNYLGRTVGTDPLYRDAKGVHGETYYYVVTAVDAATNEGPASAEASAIFSAEYVEQTFSSDLIGGWNYISLPIIPSDPDITVVLDSVAGNYSQVWAYEGQQWQVYIPGEPDEVYTLTGLTKLDNMVDGLGYIINIIEPAPWTGTGIDEKPGAVEPPAYAVAKGWNLIGFKTMDFTGVGDEITQEDSMLAGYYLRTIEDDPIIFLRYFDRGEVTFKEQALDGNMLICHGYWFYAKAAGEIAPPIVLQ